MKKVLVINGPNLNLLGIREPDIYGNETLDQVMQKLADYAIESGYEIIAKQNNSEGILVDYIQEALSPEYSAILINAGAYTHTSIAILDALKALTIPIIEVHISDLTRRETYRQKSYIAEVATDTVQGMGTDGYIKAFDIVKKHLG